MRAIDWLQFAVFLLALWALTKPLGLYLVRVLDAEGKTFLDPVLKPLERLTYRVFGIDAKREYDWKQYAVAMLLFSFVSMVFTYTLLRLQHLLPLNPQGLGALSEHLSFNTAASFTTNTNWQSYGGEGTMSYFSQMVALALHNFTSAAVGIGIAAAVVRGIARHSAKTIGNFWVDLTRTTYYLLVPLCIAGAVALISQGMIQNFKPYETVQLTEPVAATEDAQTIERQSIVQGPMASQVVIKILGTNGGGYVNANAAHPYENPTPLSNWLQMLAIFAIPSGLTYYLGRSVENQRHGWAVWAAMAVIFVVGVLVCWNAEAAGNPMLHALGVDPTDGNMEGKEVRFGIFNSALFATVTTAASCGAVNAMHDSFTAIGGLVPLLNIELGEVVFGGAGAGLYGMFVFIVLAVFIAGLMVGRTPEYLGKKIEPKEVKLASFAILILTFITLGFTAWACVSDWGKAGLNNQGPHGLSEILYAYSSAAGNNGSAFAGLTANTYWYNTTLGLAMLLGRFVMIVPILAMAGSLAGKKIVPESAGSFPVSGPLFTVLLISTVLIVGALTFFPVLALGPIVEHFLMHAGQQF